MRPALALVLGVVLLRLPTLTEPQWYSDNGFFTAVAWSMARGRPLYAGVFDDSPPGIYWLFRGLVALGAADHNWVIQGAAALAAVAASLLTLAIASRVAPGWTALLAAGLTGVLLSVPTLDGDLLNVELAGLPFFLAALLAALHGDRRGAAAAGLLVAAAVTVRPSYALDAVALLAPLLTPPEARLRRLLLAAAGGGAGLLLAAAALALSGSLGPYLSLVAPSEHAYLLWANGGSLAPVALRLVVLGAAGGIAAWRARSLGGRLAALWLAGALAGASLTPREFPHYAHEAIPAIAVTAALLVGRLRRRATAAALAAAGALAATHLLLLLPAWQTGSAQGAIGGWYPSIPYSRLPAYYGNWAAYVAGRRPAAAYAAWFPDYRQEQAAVAALRGRSSPAGTAIVVGDQPWVFVHARRLPQTRYLATNSAFWQVPTAPDRLRAELRSGTAAVVVVAPGGRGWEDDVRGGPYVEVAARPWPVYVRSGYG